jgi:hypothetical protein
MTTSSLVKGAKPIAAKDLNSKKRNPTIEDFNFPDGLPTADDLPDSDDTPVDSELQEPIVSILGSGFFSQHLLQIQEPGLIYKLMWGLEISRPLHHNW